MKVLKGIGLLAIAALLFFAGYITHDLTTEQEVTREVQFSYQSPEQPNQINVKKAYTDTEHQSVIDNAMMIFMNKNTFSEEMDAQQPDMYISMLSPKQHTGLIDARVWFTETGAVIGERAGESWDEVEYFEVSEQDADYLKEQGDYEES